MVRHRRSRISSADQISSSSSSSSSSRRSLRSSAKIYPSCSTSTLTISTTVPSNLRLYRHRHAKSGRRAPLLLRTTTTRRASSGKLRSSGASLSLPRPTNRDISYSKQNEDWDASSCSVSSKAKALPRALMSNTFRSPVRVAMPSPSSSHKEEARVLKIKSSMKDDTKMKKMDTSDRDSTTRHVSFSTTPQVIGTNEYQHPSTIWYTPLDNEQFLNDANICAQTVNRVMKYAASSFENTYNSSTGLTSPHVLQEYLSTPQEVIGIEHLLLAQKSVRECLKCHHRRAVLDSSCRHDAEERRIDADDNRSSPSSTTNTYSAIATHMAIERAAYVHLLAD